MSILIFSVCGAAAFAISNYIAFRQGAKDGYLRALEDVKRELAKNGGAQ